MDVLEIVAEQYLGKRVLARHSELKSALREINQRTETRPPSQTSEDEKQRIAAIVELCFEYRREKDPEERQNILRTLDEIAKNEPIELPTQTIEEWDDQVAKEDVEYAKLRIKNFLKKYFSLKHAAELKTQAQVAKAAGLGRTQVTVLESGEHMPQQKTLQKLARAFGVDVIQLM